MVYVSQINTLYTKYLYSAVCQSYLNETGRKKKEMQNYSSHPAPIKSESGF